MIAGITGSAAAETLVVRSSGPSAKAYPPGRSIPNAMQIVLRPNDQVVILDSRGTRTLKGPGTFSPTMATNAPADSRMTFADASQRRARPGAVRGMGVAAAAKTGGMGRSPNIWFVDIQRDTTACVPDPAHVTMWRPAGGGAGTVTVMRKADGKSRQLSWAAGESIKPWPIDLAVMQGAEYRLSWVGNPEPTIIKFAVLGPNPSGLEDMASALIKNGCDAQLDLLIETVALPEASRSGG